MEHHVINFKLDNSYIKTGYFPDIKILTHTSNQNIDNYILSKDDMKKLFITKNKIDKYYNNNDYDNCWDVIKKSTNPYEMIYITNKKERNKSVSRYDPLSRSYFKMIEMGWEFCKKELSTNKPITTAHLAEGPGGFIEAITTMRKNKNDRIFGMTLVSNSKEVPGWKKSWYFLSNNQNVNILKGIDGTGNLYNIDNHIYMENRIGNDKALIITGDGGFDFSVNFNQQEFQAQKLIFAQVILALSIQEIDGCFICKLFDTYSFVSNQILFLLMCCYRDVILFKPKTSRPANSEKYVICKGFNGISSSNIYKLRCVLDKWNHLPKNTYVLSLFDNIPYNYLSVMKHINKLIQNEQTNYIESTICLMENPINFDMKYAYTLEEQIQLAQEWCIKYKIDYNY